MNLHTLPRQRYKTLLSEFTLSIMVVRKLIEKIGCLVIGIGMLKGGSGKTTSTIYMALWLSVCLGLKVLVIDTDDNSQSVDMYVSTRENKPEPEDVPFDILVLDLSKKDSPDLDDEIEDKKDQYDVILVDTGGAEKKGFWELCTVAHFILMPLAPSAIEVHRVAPTIRQASSAYKKNPGLKLFVTLVKVDSRTSLGDEYRPAVKAAIDVVDKRKYPVPVSMVKEEFEISGATHYPRLLDNTPTRMQLEEFGLLIRHMMKYVDEEVSV